MVANAPDFDVIVNDINRIIKGKTLLAYNAEYDIRLMKQSLEATKIGSKKLYLESVKFGCVMQAFSQWFGELDEKRGGYRRHKLVDAAIVTNMNTTGLTAHRAYGDCMMTLHLVREMADSVDSIKTGFRGGEYFIFRTVGLPDRLTVSNGTQQTTFDVQLARLLEDRNGYHLYVIGEMGGLTTDIKLDTFSGNAVRRMFPRLKYVASENQGSFAKRVLKTGVTA